MSNVSPEELESGWAVSPEGECSQVSLEPEVTGYYAVDAEVVDLATAIDSILSTDDDSWTEGINKRTGMDKSEIKTRFDKVREAFEAARALDQNF